MLFILLLSFVLLATPSLGRPADEPSSQVWKVEDRRWTVEEELRFGKWVEDNITEDFLNSFGRASILTFRGRPANTNELKIRRYDI